MQLSKEKEDPDAPSIAKRRSKELNQKLQCPNLILQMIEFLCIQLFIYFRYTEYHGTTYVIRISNVQCSFSMGCTTTTLQSKTLPSPPPQNKNDWVHLVIFEPQPKTQLTRSSYKVT